MLTLRNILKASLSSMMVVLIFTVLFLVFGVTQPACVNKISKLVIDHDGGADDAMAIFMAFLYEKYYNGPEVLALTTTHGNVDETQAYNNTQRILDIANRRNIPIYRGSANALIQSFPQDNYFGVDGLGDNLTATYAPIEAQKEHAVFQLIEFSKTYEGDLKILALGALTNIALAIRIDPEFISRLSQLYVAAGHIYGEAFKQPEFNAAMDVEAYRIVAESGTVDKLTIIPFSQILLSQNISKEWRTDELGSIQTNIIKSQNVFEQKSIKSDSDNWSFLDPSAMAIVLDESAIVEEIVYSNNSIILCGDLRGINTNNFTSKEEANARLIYKVKTRPYEELLYNLFSKDLGN